MRRIRAYCRSHPITVLIVLLAESAVVCSWMFHPVTTISGMALFIAQLVCIACAPSHPYVTFVAGMVMDVCVTLFQLDSGPTPLYAALTAFGFLCFQGGNVMSALMLVLFCCVQAFELAWGKAYIGVPDVLSTVIVFTLTTLLGCGLRWQRDATVQRHEKEALRIELNNREHDIRVATQLHDAITNSLSLIARTAQRQIRLNGHRDEQPWEFINQEALNALRQSHLIIDGLRRHDAEGTAPDLPDASLNRQLREVLQRHDDNLHRLGFTGQCVYDDSAPLRLDKAKQRLLIMVLNEIYANIVRHAPAGCRYDCSVICTGERIEITQINPLGSASDQPRSLVDDLPKSEYGLRGLSAQLRKVHGTLLVERSDVWTVFASMPNTAA